MNNKTALRISILSILMMAIVVPSAWGEATAPTSGYSLRAERLAARRPLAAARAAKKAPTLAKQCKTIKAVNFLIKADTSNHIPGGDSRRGSYSVIGSSDNCSPCSSGLCSILYKDGTSAGSVGYYGQWSRSHGGNGCARYYGGSGGAGAHSASAIIATARRKGRKLYLKSGSTCYEWSSESRRVGHV